MYLNAYIAANMYCSCNQAVRVSCLLKVITLSAIKTYEEVEVWLH